MQDEELSILTELTHIQEIVHSLCLLSSDPDSLPESTEHLIDDMLSDGKTRHQLKQVISTCVYCASVRHWLNSAAAVVLSGFPQVCVCTVPHFLIVGKTIRKCGTAVSYTHLTLPTILRV